MSQTPIVRPILAWRARDVLLDAATGQTGSCVRAGTATLTDVNAATVTLVTNQPRFQSIDTNADSIMDTVVFKGAAQTTDYLQWAVPIPPQPLTWYLKLINRGAPGSTMVLGCLSSAHASLTLFKTTSNTYQLEHHNGTSAVTSTSAAATSGHTLELRAVLRATGVVQLYVSMDGGAEVAATASSALTLAAAFGNSDARLAGGVSGNSCDDDIFGWSLWPGELTQAVCRSQL